MKITTSLPPRWPWTRFYRPFNGGERRVDWQWDPLPFSVPWRLGMEGLKRLKPRISKTLNDNDVPATKTQPDTFWAAVLISTEPIPSLSALFSWRAPINMWRSHLIDLPDPWSVARIPPRPPLPSTLYYWSYLMRIWLPQGTGVGGLGGLGRGETAEQMVLNARLTLMSL